MVSFSVAMTTRLPTRRGCAYTSPSRVGDVHCLRTLFAGDGPSVARPVRLTSPSYVVQCAPARFDAGLVEGVEALVVDEPPDRCVPDEHAPSMQETSTTPTSVPA